ncbi:MAG TPA: NAD-dependent epimerase/dehydratase family protein [Casimicrobiaceae bacterium]|nr:NAD-dependent epimerase/dehydratase family protein [Casimicrobiaceae bacterium]
MRVMVTGANGFLGFEAVRRLLARGDGVIAMDTAIGPHLHALAGADERLHVMSADLTDLANVAHVFKVLRPDAVLHFAAVVGVLASLGSPSNILRVNVQGSLNLFEAMRLFGVRRVIHLSSEEVYGDFVATPASEDHPQVPLMPYGVTKLAVEHFGRTYRELHGIECINVRASWVYGVRLDRPRPPMNYLNAALRGEAVNAPRGAETTIDYTYVDDVIDGVLLALDHMQHRFDVYNIASGTATSDHDLATLIEELVPGATVRIGPGRREFAPGIRIPIKGALDCSRARAELGYQPKFDIRRGLETYVAEWRKLHGNGSARIPEPVRQRLSP